jgi:outer membrane receptor protein involved in Fe transport
MVAKYNYDDWSNENARAIPAVRPEADATDERTFKTGQVEVFGILSPSLSLNLQGGTTDNETAVLPVSGDLATIGHLDLATGVFSVNYMDAQSGTEGRDQVRGDLSWFVDDFGGTHQIKAGADLSWVTFSNERFMPGGFNYLDRAGKPYVLQQLDPSGGSYKGNYLSIFLQDAWQPVRSLTVNLGVRYDKTTYDVTTTGVRVASMDQVQPRLGVAWDATGDGKTVARGFYGEFMHPGALTIPLLAMSASAATYLECSVLRFPSAEICAQLAPQYGMPYLPDPGYYPGKGWALVAPGSSGGLVVDPNLQGPKAKQWTLGIERAVFRNTSVGLQYIDKRTDRFFESTCNGNVPTPSEQAACDYLLITNDVPAKRDYTGWVLSFSSRPSDKLTLLASYTYSKSEGSLELTQGAGVDFDVYPIHFDNRYGYLSNDRRHQLKVNGMWLLPYQFSLGFGFNWNSPFRWTPEDPVVTQGYGTYYTEPRGNREGKSFYQLDLQLAKRFTIGKTLGLETILSVMNVTNVENATAVCTSTYGCLGTQATGDPSRWQLPRRAELGLRLTY